MVHAIIRRQAHCQVPPCPPSLKIWCPFDTEHSNYVKYLRQLGYNVVATHIDDGTDFFNTTVDCDYIISNPPYSCKTEVFERLFELDKPFAMLVGMVGVFESQRRFNLFKNNKFEIMNFNKRVSFFKNYDDQKPNVNPPFSTGYICHNMLPKQIVFEVIDKE